MFVSYITLTVAVTAGLVIANPLPDPQEFTGWLGEVDEARDLSSLLIPPEESEIFAVGNLNGPPELAYDFSIQFDVAKLCNTTSFGTLKGRDGIPRPYDAGQWKEEIVLAGETVARDLVYQNLLDVNASIVELQQTPCGTGPPRTTKRNEVGQLTKRQMEAVADVIAVPIPRTALGHLTLFLTFVSVQFAGQWALGFAWDKAEKNGYIAELPGLLMAISSTYTLTLIQLLEWLKGVKSTRYSEALIVTAVTEAFKFSTQVYKDLKNKSCPGITTAEDNEAAEQAQLQLADQNNEVVHVAPLQDLQTTSGGIQVCADNQQGTSDV